MTGQLLDTAAAAAAHHSSTATARADSRVLAVGDVYEDRRDLARPFAFTIKLGQLVRRERYHRRADADHARRQAVRDVADLAARLAR